MISGYALHAAGLIDKKLKPTGKLSNTECAEFKLADPPSEEGAMAAFLNLYTGFILEALSHLDPAGERGEWELRLQDHLNTAAQWLIEHGHIRQVCLETGSPAVN